MNDQHDAIAFAFDELASARRALLEAAKRLDAARRAAELAAESFGDADTKAAEWWIRSDQLARARLQVNQLNGNLR